MILWDEYIDRFILSEDMKSYLEDLDLPEDKLVEMIFYSPVQIKDKKEAFRELIEQARADDDKVLLDMSNRCLWNIEEAERLLTVPGVFSVLANVYYSKERKSEECFDIVCATFKDVEDYIWNHYGVYKDNKDEAVWFEVTKWCLDDAGKYVEMCTYYIADDEVIYTNLNDERYRSEDCINFYAGVDLNLPVPFRAGDIVAIDRYPFADTVFVLITDVGDNKDCCSLCGLSRNEENEWYEGAIKHGLICDMIFPQVSPLYTIRKYDGELKDEDRYLLKARDGLEGDTIGAMTDGRLIIEPASCI